MTSFISCTVNVMQITSLMKNLNGDSIEIKVVQQ